MIRIVPTIRFVITASNNGMILTAFFGKNFALRHAHRYAPYITTNTLGARNIAFTHMGKFILVPPKPETETSDLKHLK